jgi:hypothetical protein
MKSASLANHNHDLKSYCATLMDMNAVVNMSTHTTEEVITAFLAQTNTHQNDIVCSHFNQIGIKFFMRSPDKEQWLMHLLDTSDHLHTVTTSPALPFCRFCCNVKQVGAEHSRFSWYSAGKHGKSQEKLLRTSVRLTTKSAKAFSL